MKIDKIDVIKMTDIDGNLESQRKSMQIDVNQQKKFQIIKNYKMNQDRWNGPSLTKWTKIDKTNKGWLRSKKGPFTYLDSITFLTLVDFGQFYLAISNSYVNFVQYF